MSLDQEKRRPQPACALANNLPANAADCVKAVHGRDNGPSAPAAVKGPKAAACGRPKGLTPTLTFSPAFSRWTDPGPRTAGAHMRSLLATITFAILLGASAAQAEKRIFIVANNADGYGVDRCLASGDTLRQGRGNRLLQVARVRPGDVLSARSTRTRSPARSRPTPAAAKAAVASNSSPSSARAKREAACAASPQPSCTLTAIRLSSRPVPRNVRAPSTLRAVPFPPMRQLFRRLAHRTGLLHAPIGAGAERHPAAAGPAGRRDRAAGRALRHRRRRFPTISISTRRATACAAISRSCTSMRRRCSRPSSSPPAIWTK